jgi:hypothetical protein
MRRVVYMCTSCPVHSDKAGKCDTCGCDLMPVIYDPDTLHDDEDDQ